MADTEAPSEPDTRTTVERALGVFTEVRAGESTSALLLTCNVFLLLASYYIIKPVRDALIISMPDGASYKAYMGAAVAIALLLAVPAYGAYAKRVPRNKLVVGVTLFFVSHIILFAFGTTVESSKNWMPLVFYLWVGVFNMMVVAQFWAFANDVYTEEQGKRLFALIGIGASAGASAGAFMAKILPLRPVPSLNGECSAVTEQAGYLTTFQLLLVSGGLLSLCALLTQVVHVRETKAVAEAHAAATKKKAEETSGAEDTKNDSGDGAFAMVFKHRYLLLLAAFSLLFTLVNTNGEFIVSKLVKDHVSGLMAQCTFESKEVAGAYASGLFTSWYGDFYFYVNIVGVILQSFVVSRLVKFGGLKVAFMVLPIIALFGALAVALIPALYILRPAKIAENATDYSINNTTRNMLWLPTTRQMKYQAKQAVDTFFVRMGDVASAGLVFLFTMLGMLSVRIFAIINVVLIGVWIVLAIQILREKKVLTAKRESGELPDD